MHRIAFSRRTLLGGSVLVATACGPTGTADLGWAGDEDVAILWRVIDAEETILDRYTEGRRRHPGLAGRLDPIIAHHREHLAALRRRLPPNAPSAPTTPPSPTPGSGAVPAPMPGSPNGVIAALAAQEDAAARARVRDVGAASAPLAQLLASVGASEASHAALLSKGA